jgi:phospholipid/cholesterol/gamma-HCH transport system permease protein
MLSFSFFPIRTLFDFAEEVFCNPDKFSIYWKEVMRQMVEIGVGSLVIKLFFLFFRGCVYRPDGIPIQSLLLSRSIIGSL